MQPGESRKAVAYAAIEDYKQKEVPLTINYTNVKTSAAFSQDTEVAYDVPSVVLQDDLVGVWHFDDASWTDSDFVKDSSGNGNHLTNDTSGVSQVSGKFGSAADLAGGWNALMRTTFSPVLTDDMTACMWINLATSGEYGLFGLEYMSGFDRASFNVVSEDIGSSGYSEPHFVVKIGTSEFGTGGKDYPKATDHSMAINTWNHLCVSFVSSTGTTSIYTNGNLALASAPYGSYSIAHDLLEITIGNTDSTAAGLDGKVDEVIFWKRALSASEIRDVYSAGI